MKKINKHIFCTLTLISSTFLPYLTINVKIDTNLPRAKTWTEDSGNIKKGHGGFMFEDSRHNLWSAGTGTALQRYDYSTHTWETSDDIAGNLSNGTGGFMFEDSRHNLWSAGHSTPLQKYDYDNSRWETSNDIAGNLSNGIQGFMFEDKRGNLWSAGHGTALQKYDYIENKWKTSPEISGNLSNGRAGFMFQDSRGNLWSAGHSTPLQKYDYDNSRWETSNDIAGNLSNGWGGFMFEDSRRNLWSVGTTTPLQRYDYDTRTWDWSPQTSGKLKNGLGGFMFEDSRRNLWSAGANTPLQRYNYDTRTWDWSPQTSGRLKNGLGGFMFEDSKHNLWSAGYGAALQKYDYGNSRWETDEATKTTNAGNLSNGTSGFMFEDSKGHLWSAGHGTKLQVMYSDKDVASVIALIQANTRMTKIATGEILPILTSSNTPFDGNTLSSLGTGGTFPGDTKGTTLTYAHEGITSDGDLTVAVKIAKGRATAFASFIVVVRGIDLAKTKVQKEANKFGDFGSTDSLNSAAAILSQNTENVKTQFETITGYKVPSLTDGYSISKIIVKTALDPKTKKVVYTVTISDTNSNIATKDIVVTFVVKAISKDKDLSKGAIAGITIGSILGVGILGFLIYHLFKKLKK